MELLAGGEGLLTKTSCGRWWHGASERHYSLRLPTGQVVASSGPGIGQVSFSKSKSWSIIIRKLEYDEG